MVLWDDSPLRWHKIVMGAGRIQPRITHFVIASTVVERLTRDGVNARYFPVYYVDPGYMTREALGYRPEADVLLCGNVADTAQFLDLLPGPGDTRHRVAMRFLELKAEREEYADELDFMSEQGLDLNAVEQPHFLAILTGIQRTVDRTRIL